MGPSTHWGKIALFLSGLFFGGAMDHAILASMGSGVTPYGVHSGVGGNWGLAALDSGLTALLYLVHRRLERGSALGSGQ